MAKKKKQTTNQIKQALTTDNRRGVQAADLLKTGSTVLDLALSGKRGGGFLKGKYFWVAGDSSSGKTFLTLTCLAEASINPAFDGYRFIYDNVEDGALMDMRRYFGKRMADRCVPPAVANGAAVYSQEIEQFYFHLDDALKRAEDDGEQFIYVLDSMDSLDSKYAEKKFQEAKKADRGGPAAKGDYGDGKAKINSTRIRKVVNRLSQTGSILIILSQTRDNIDAGMFDEKQTTAGGRSLKFYATAQLMSSVGSKIKKSVQERDLVVGVHCRVRIRKNRLTGKERTVEFPIYYDTGIDDIGGMVDYLTYWKHWPKARGGLIDATADFDEVHKRRDDLIVWIEENGLRDDLEEIVEDAWNDIENRVKVERKNKYE